MKLVMLINIMNSIQSTSDILVAHMVKSNQMIDFEKPLVTMAVIAYNQERYVGDAIASALAQDYSRLEIILSDDCSTDATYEVMQQCAKAYSGPHKIVLNRNTKNLHIGGHVNTVNRLATGELVIAAAGDDVSAPHRVRTLVDAWMDSDRKAGVLHSACTLINEEGKAIKEIHCPCLAELKNLEQAAKYPAFVIGATEGWHKEIFKQFGDLRPDIVHEDHALGFRSLLAGKPIVYVDKSLVFYRQGVGISTVYGSRHVGPRDRRTMLGRYWTDAQQKLDDLKVLHNPRIEYIVNKAALRYAIALKFEDAFPRLSEWLPMVRDVGILHVLRMTLKRIKNLYLDK